MSSTPLSESTSGGGTEGLSSVPFEQSLAELESVVHDLEEGQLGLAGALARYEQGIQHLRHCYQLLEQAERKIELLTGVANDDSPITQLLDGERDSLAEAAGRKRRKKKAAREESGGSGPAAAGDIDLSRG